jgi:membrane protein
MTKIQRIIISWAPIAWIIRKSKSFRPVGLQGLPLFDVVRFFFRQINTHGLNERAAAISFNFIMAIPASLIFLATLIPYFPKVLSDGFRNQLFMLVKDMSPNSAVYAFLRDDVIYELIDRPRGGLLSIGILITFFYASNAMMGIIRSFDRSINERPKSDYPYQKRVHAIRLTSLLFFIFLTTIVVLLTQGALLENLFKWLHIKNAFTKWTIRVVRWFIYLGLFYFFIGCIYRYAPTIKNRWPIRSAGTFFATFLTIVTTLLFSKWVNSFGQYNRVYGSIGTVLIMMLLVFFNSMVLLIGFELNVAMKKLRAEVQERDKKEQQAALVSG